MKTNEIKSLHKQRNKLSEIDIRLRECERKREREKKKEILNTIKTELNSFLFLSTMSEHKIFFKKYF